MRPTQGGWQLTALAASLVWSVGCQSADGKSDCLNCYGCDGWRTASCEYADRCGAGSDRCLAQYSAIACASEQQAEDCAYEIHDARCGRVEVECKAARIADSRPAIDGCQRYRETVCSSAVMCGFAATMESCLARPAVDCQAAVALSASYAQCLIDLAAVRCERWVPPDSCVGVVITAD